MSRKDFVTNSKVCSIEMQCPTVDNLTQFAQGTLDNSSVDEIEQHLLECETCRLSLSELEKTLDDPLYQTIRKYSFRPDNAEIEGFQLGKMIGDGGMGSVYEAIDETNGELRAIKILHPHRHFDPSASARFRREKETIIRLDHPNIVKSFSSDNPSVIVMERLLGSDLANFVKEHAPLPVEQVENIVLQTAKGLEYAHQNGIIHRDIKPSNLFLTENGTVKILDLGLVRFEKSDTTSAHTRTDQIVGTIDFLSPEQSVDPKSVEQRSDIYSLGCTIYYLLTGQPPFTGHKYKTIGSKIAGHARDVPADIRKLRPDIPVSFAKILSKMLEKEPRRRFRTMDELVDAFAQQRTQRSTHPLLVVLSFFLIVFLVSWGFFRSNSNRTKSVDTALVSSAINNVEQNAIADLNQTSLPETRQISEVPENNESRKIRIKYHLAENGKASFQLEKQDSPMETAFEGDPMLIPEHPKLKAKRNSKGVIQLLYDFNDFDRNDPYCGYGNDSGGGWRLESPYFVLEDGVGGCFVNYFESLPLFYQCDIDDCTGNDLFLTVEECTRHLDPNTLQAVNQLSINANEFLFFAWQRNRHDKSVKDLLLNTSNRRHSIPFEQYYAMETGTQFKYPALMCYLWQKVGNKQSPGRIKIRRMEIQGKMLEQAEALRRSQRTENVPQ